MKFEQPSVLETTTYESTFGAAGTSTVTAVSETVACYRTRAADP